MLSLPAEIRNADQSERWLSRTDGDRWQMDGLPFYTYIRIHICMRIWNSKKFNKLSGLLIKAHFCSSLGASRQSQWWSLRCFYHPRRALFQHSCVLDRCCVPVPAKMRASNTVYHKAILGPSEQVRWLRTLRPTQMKSAQGYIFLRSSYRFGPSLPKRIRDLSCDSGQPRP